MDISKYYQKYQADYQAAFNDTTMAVDQKMVTGEKWLETSLSVLLTTRELNRNIFLIGNGASCSMASHFSTDFTKNGRMSAFSVNEGALLTCFSNDFSFETAYENILRWKMQDGDLLFAISSSGTSKNIVNAASFVRSEYPQSKVFTFTGFQKKNPVLELGNINLWVPFNDYGIVESIHSYFLQFMVDTLTVYSSENSQEKCQK